MTGEYSSPNLVNLNTVPKAQSMKNVEGKLWETLKLLAGTEGNIYLFSTLIKMGLATNDVRHFVYKQTVHRKSNKKVDNKLKRSAMQSKLSDACSYAKKLRQTKNSLRKKTLQKYQTDGQTGKRVYRDMVKKYRVLKNEMMYNADKKIQLYKEKEDLQKSLKSIPPVTSDILSGLKLFSETQNEIKPEPLVGPFVCDSSLKFSENELKVLAKGPKFMVRDELSMESFKVEVEKMIAKKKIDNFVNSSDLDSEEDQPVSNSSPFEHSRPNPTLKSAASIQNENQMCRGNNSKINSEVNCKWEEWSGHMIYNEATKNLDFGNLQASRYKHNKELFFAPNRKGRLRGCPSN